VIALEHHVHALEHVTVVIVAEGQNALGAQDLLTLAGDEVCSHGMNLVGSSGLSDRNDSDCMSSSW